MQIAHPIARATELQEQAQPGLISAFCFDPDGSAHELPVERRIPAVQSWIWLHFNLANVLACPYLKFAAGLPAAARELLIAPEAHQQLDADEICLHGVFADLICDLGAAATDEIGFLHFAVTDKAFISGADVASIHSKPRAVRRS